MGGRAGGRAGTRVGGWVDGLGWFGLVMLCLLCYVLFVAGVFVCFFWLVGCLFVVFVYLFVSLLVCLFVCVCVSTHVHIHLCIHR